MTLFSSFFRFVRMKFISRLQCANIGPADYNYDETISTLRYATRAKSIKNRARINEDPKDALLRQFQSEIEELKKKLEGCEDGTECFFLVSIVLILCKSFTIKMRRTWLYLNYFILFVAASSGSEEEGEEGDELHNEKAEEEDSEKQKKKELENEKRQTLMEKKKLEIMKAQ